MELQGGPATTHALCGCCKRLQRTDRSAPLAHFQSIGPRQARPGGRPLVGVGLVDRLPNLRTFTVLRVTAWPMTPVRGTGQRELSQQKQLRAPTQCSRMADCNAQSAMKERSLRPPFANNRGQRVRARARAEFQSKREYLESLQ